MLFNSYMFVFVFLPLSIIGYFLLNKIKPVFARLYLLIMFLWFYGYFSYKCLSIIIASILINYAIYKALLSFEKMRIRKIVLIVAIFFNVGLLFYYKYYDFFIEPMNQLFESDYNLHHLVLPLGISFFTFQQLSFIIDSYKGEVD